jgi:3',5'-cyclic AMP phosphodiesterase CpdA
MMLIAQLTDIHLGYELNNPDEPNISRFDAALSWLKNLSVMPDMLFLTGDLTDHGDVASYERLRDMIADLPFPVHLCVGNHDDRAVLRQVFPDIPMTDGFVEYVIDRPEARFIVIDTLEEGTHGGAFCTARAARLRRYLSETPVNKPVMIALHHPPIETGIPWMTAEHDDYWVEMLDGAIGDRKNVTIICGHIHRSITTNWRGRMLTICPSTAPQVSLELAPIDPDAADNRPLITAELPGGALHMLNGGSFVTHHMAVGDHPVLARYTPALEPMIRHMVDEHLKHPQRRAAMYR